jgi:DNA-binding MarR family transcriptional regulator
MACSSAQRRSRQILIWLGAAEQRLVTRVTRALKGVDLPYAQFVILNHLASLPAGGWTVTELASVLEIGQPGVSKILHRLANKGYVQIDTDPGDARVRRHRLTRDGAVAHGEAFRRIIPQAENIFSGWQDAEIDALHRLLYKLKSSLRS